MSKSGAAMTEKEIQALDAKLTVVAIIVSVAIVLATLFLSISSAIYLDEDARNGVILEESGNHYVVVGYEGASPDVVIPTEYKGKPVTVIASCAFENRTDIRSVTIPHNVTEVGDRSFYGCTSLADVIMSNAIKRIGDEAFYNCASLIGIAIPRGVGSIGYCAFGDCTSLTNVNIPDAVTYMGYDIFIGCNDIAIFCEAVSKPNGWSSDWNSGVDTVAWGCVRDNDGIIFNNVGDCYEVCGYIGTANEVVIPSSRNGKTIVGILDGAFSNLKNIVSVTIPSTVESISVRAFDGCTSLTSINVNEGNTAYMSADGNLYSKDGSALIQYAKGKSNNSFVVPSTVTSIGDMAFKDCTGLTSIAIHSGVVSIGDNAFQHCNSLASITIPNSTTSIGSDAFGDCTNLNIYCEADLQPSAWNANWNSAARPVEWGCQDKYVTFRDKGDYYEVVGYKRSATEIVISALYNGKPVKAISDNAFSNCTSLVSVIIPESVASISTSAFDGCSGLASITVAEGNASYKSVDGNLYTKDGRTLVRYAIGKKNANFSIPDSVNNIGNNAFDGCTSLTDVAIHDGVLSIGASAFDGCIGLTSVTIPDSVTSIGASPFSGCVSLSSMTIPFVENHFGCLFGAPSYLENANYVPSSLRSVVVTGEASISDNAFSGCSGITSMSILNALATMGSNSLAGCTSISELTIPNAANRIGYLFGASSYNNNANFVPASLKTVVISGGSIVCDEAFTGCEEITSVTIPNTVMSIGDSAFSDCIGLTTITIPDSISGIGDEAFLGCYRLVEIINNSGLQLTAGSSNYGNVARYALEVHKGYSKIVNQNGYLFYTNGSINSLFAYIGEDASLELPDSYNGEGYAINSYAFYNLLDLTSVVIPSGITSVGNYAFSDCTSLSSVTIGNRVEGIGDYAFSDCTSLSSVTIGNSVEGIGDYAFKGCSRLASVNIPSSVASMGSYAFTGCTGLLNVYITDVASWCNITYGNAYASPLYYSAKLCVNGSSLANLIIPEGVTAISAYAFKNQSGIRSVTIPSTVKSIGENAFESCTNLVDVYAKDVALWCNISYSGTNANPLYHASKLYIDGSLITNLTIPESVTAIPDYAFKGQSTIKSVTIPNSVTQIGSYAFDGCASIESIAVPSSTNNIGVAAFRGCSKLTSITLPYIGAGRNTSVSHFGYIFGASSYSGNGNYVPKSLKRVVVTEAKSVSASAFSGCSYLTSITIPNGATSIGASAFSGCTSLVDITIPFVGATKNGTSNTHFGYIFGASGYLKNSDYVPSSLKTVTITNATSIAGEAFYECASLTGVTIPDGVTSIGSMAFYKCTNLLSVTIPNSVMSISSYAFSQCTSLKEMVVPNRITTIQLGTFHCCSALTSVTIPSSVTNIENEAFYGCEGLENVYITDIAAWCNISYGTESINPMYYANNLYIGGEQITNLVIPDGVTTIPAYAFKGLSNITSISVPNSVTSIGYAAFSGCSNLESITIPFVGASLSDSMATSDVYQYPLGYIFGEVSYDGGIETQQNYLFDNYVSKYTAYYIPSKLTSITITGGNITYGAFSGCTGLTSVTIGSNVVSMNDYGFKGCTGITSVKILSGVTSIKGYALSGCSKLTSITIPDSVTSIGISAFSGCETLAEIIVADENASYQSIDGNLYTKDGKTLVQYAPGKTETAFIIPNSVTSVGNSALLGCTSLTSVTIPEGVTSIGDYAFKECTNLASATIPNGVVRLSKSMFHSCTSLTSVSIPNSVTNIGDYAFYGCESLTRAIIPEGVKQIGTSVFYNCSQLEHVSILSGVAYVGNSAFYGCTKLTIYCEAASRPSNWNSSWNPSNCTVVWGHTSENCLDEIEDGKCDICGRLTTNQSPNSPSDFKYTTSSGSITITNYTGTDTTVVIPSDIYGTPVATIADNAFYQNAILETITIPDSVTSIGALSFYGCTNLTVVTIPSSVTNIGSNAFARCSKLTEITVASENNSYQSIEGNLYTKDGKTLVQYAIGKSNTDFTVKYGVTSIASNAFFGCESLTSVFIAYGVANIGTYAFSGCTNLVSVSMHDGMTIIDNGAFSGCTSLKDITIPSSVTSIGKEAFYGCTSLKNITIPSSVTSIGSYAFASCTGLGTVVIPNSVKSVGYGAFYGCTNLSIYCEAASKPSGWNSNWNISGGSVVWGW